MISYPTLPNPKQNGVPYVGRSTWYPYYAGFSTVFANSVLERFAAQPNMVVCDPWNGAGTTTQMAFDNAIQGFGFDINPVMAVVARARLATSAHLTLLDELHEIVSVSARRFKQKANVTTDPLMAWLSTDAVSALRHLQRALKQSSDEEVAHSVFEVAVFRTLRRLLQSSRSSNPTWTKRPKTNGRVTCTKSQLLTLWDEEVSAMIDGLRRETIDKPQGIGKVLIKCGRSTSLELPDASVDLVLASPPYCTRIDYAVSTAVELAYMGLDIWGKNRDFRHEVTGTTTIRKSLVPVNDGWGGTCVELLRQIKKHSSKASAAYYYKTHVQYFDDIYRSICELSRVLKVNGRCVLVVQDSYYKALRNDVATIVSQMGSNIGFATECRTDYPVRLDLGRVNPRAASRQSKCIPVESVLQLVKIG